MGVTVGGRMQDTRMGHLTLISLLGPPKETISQAYKTHAYKRENKNEAGGNGQSKA